MLPSTPPNPISESGFFLPHSDDPNDEKPTNGNSMSRLRYIYTQPNMFVLLNVLEVMASKCLDSNVPEWCQGQRTSIKFGHGYLGGRFKNFILIKSTTQI
ncbi:hypothetical protein CDAR_238641 [Caerostris darwini]|uniref:Uncharacterized protein n=1 Tax=Caerostris darwini TaxID=1538125 RepID=A0AAV4QHY0_9ARAC|nr:hypothetical protein CDAR_238641 [Caerostris darwini]